MGPKSVPPNNAVRGYNPRVDDFLTIYSQSERSTGGTRGYDPETYVETKLDRSLTPRIFDPQTKLVVLTGNAGDGKTAFVQHLEQVAREKGATFSTRSDQGCTFALDGVVYQTLYDGSQDFEGTTNDAVLAAFFRRMEGDHPPEGSLTNVVAINEGKLRDFILNKPQYRWIGKQVHHQLNFASFTPDNSLIFVNLNLRSVVDDGDDGTSILDRLLDRFLQQLFWGPCAPSNCDDAETCPLRYNVNSLSDPRRGPEIRRRIKHLLLAVHFRKIRHITIRDLRSILSLVLFGKSPCSVIHERLRSGDQMIGGFYYNAAVTSSRNSAFMSQCRSF